jgi:hypothetical protein
MAKQGLGSMLSGLGGGMMDKAGVSPLGGLALAGNPLSGIGLLKGIFGGGGDEDKKPNPGMQMFKGVGSSGVDPQGGGSPDGPNFLSKFGGNLQEMLFQQLMGRMGGY